MTHSPLVSVITPCYNSALWLEATVASALAQTHQNIELLLIDDGSTDGTRALIEKMAQNEPRILPSFWPNGGAATARNRGLQQARGEFVQFLDADDLLLPTAIEQRLHVLEHSGADVAYSDWQKLEEVEAGVFREGSVVARKIEDIDADPAIAMFTDFWCPPAALLYRRSIVERIGGWKQHLAPIEDARYMLDAVLSGGRYVYTQGVGARYRLYGGPSHSRRSPLRFLQAVLANTVEIEEVWNKNEAASAAHRIALARAYDYAARSLFKLDLADFDRAMSGLYRNRPGFEPTLPKLAAIGRRVIGRDLTLRLLRMSGKLPA